MKWQVDKALKSKNLRKSCDLRPSARADAERQGGATDRASRPRATRGKSRHEPEANVREFYRKSAKLLNIFYIGKIKLSHIHQFVLG
jgi:hypothetical protein